VYLSSADWMTRNLTRRIELMCPVFDKALCKSLIQMLHLKLRDNAKARELQLNGTYMRVRQENQPCRSQFEAMHIEAWKAVPVRV
jgi:polyphosphate kinase